MSSKYIWARKDEFAIFAGVQDDHREHGVARQPAAAYRVEGTTGRASQRWDLPSLNLVFTASLAGGSRSVGENWFILLEPRPKGSH